VALAALVGRITASGLGGANIIRASELKCHRVFSRSRSCATSSRSHVTEAAAGLAATVAASPTVEWLAQTGHSYLDRRRGFGLACLTRLRGGGPLAGHSRAMPLARVDSHARAVGFHNLSRQRADRRPRSYAIISRSPEHPTDCVHSSPNARLRHTSCASLSSSANLPYRCTRTPRLLPPLLPDAAWLLRSPVF